MRRSTLPFLLALCAAPQGFARSCLNMTIPVNVSARTGIFDIAVPHTSLEATTFIQNMTQQGRNFTETALTGYQTTQGSYNISAMLCLPSTPSNGSSAGAPSTVQVLTHGIGFDKTYWDLSYNNYNYSYVNSALAAGYATFSYDRLGIGNSSHGEPLNEIQSFLEVAALAELSTMLRNGTMPGYNSSFSTVVHVGHSFGSAQTYALVDMYPGISDGIVLTGFSMNASFVGYFLTGGDFVLANLNQPFRFGNVSQEMVASVINMYGLTDYIAGVEIGYRTPYADGYLTNTNINANQLLFFLPGYFDAMIGLLGENTKQPVTVGELLTLGSAPMMNSYAGPVFVVTGSNDLPYCGGDCLATGDPAVASIPAAVKNNFPGARSFRAYIQPQTGHGINLHYNATGAYDVIQSFFKSL